MWQTIVLMHVGDRVKEAATEAVRGVESAAEYVKDRVTAPISGVTKEGAEKDKYPDDAANAKNANRKLTSDSNARYVCSLSTVSCYMNEPSVSDRLCLQCRLCSAWVAGAWVAGLLLFVLI